MKNQKGITLIVLIITILVMLILAAVTISLVVSEDGVLSKAQTAERKMSLAEVEEKAELVAADLKTDIETKNFTGNVTEEYLNRLKEQFGENCQIEGNTIIIGNGKYKIIVKNDDLDREVIDTTDDTNNTQIDYEEIGQIIANIFLGEITEEEGMSQLKEKGVIEDTTDLFAIQNENEEINFYFHKIKALYKMNMSDLSIIYIEKEGNLEEYVLLENMVLAKKELENIFLGRDFVNEFGNKTSKEIIEFILDNSEKIINIDEMYLARTGIKIRNITIKNGENETTFGEDTVYTILLKCENNIVKEVLIRYGT